mgnify:CR=1 FL=1
MPMPIPSLPGGYDVTKRVSTGRADCHITVGFDRENAHIPRFIVLLHYSKRTLSTSSTSSRATGQ